MATRNLTMVVNRDHYEDFTERMMDITPYSMTEYSQVNMYLHHDGYPEWQGIQLANWYLYNNPNQIDHQYTYIIFVGDGETLILCYDQYSDKEVFCYTPQEVLNKYMDDMDYTDFANGEIRNSRQVHVYAGDSPKKW